jgi:hypothetical protein
VTVLYFIWISVSLFCNFLLTTTFYICVFIYLLNLLLIIVLYLLYVCILTRSVLLIELGLIRMSLTCSVFYGLWPVFELPRMRIKWMNEWMNKSPLSGIHVLKYCVHPNFLCHVYWLYATLKALMGTCCFHLDINVNLSTYILWSYHYPLMKIDSKVESYCQCGVQ